MKNAHLFLYICKNNETKPYLLLIGYQHEKNARKMCKHTNKYEINITTHGGGKKVRPLP